MANTDSKRDKMVTRAVHRLFWRAMVHTPGYFVFTVVCHAPAFFIMNVYVPLQIAYGIEAIITRHFGSVDHYALSILILTIIGQTIYAVGTWAFNRNGVYGGSFVQRQVFTNYLAKDYEFYGGSYIGALGAQAARLRDAFTDYNRIALFDIPRNAVIVIASLIVVALKSLPLAIISLLCMAVVFSVTLLFSKYRLKYRRLVSEASSHLAGILGDALSHATAVKSFANEDYEHGRLNKPLSHWEKMQLKSWDLFTPQNYSRNLLLAITMAVLLVVSAHLYRQGKISIAIIALVQLYVIRLINVTIDLSEIIKQYETLMSGAYQAVATMLVPLNVSDPVKPLSLGSKKAHEIVFDKVSYHYPEVAKGVNAIDGFSLRVKPGEKIGLVGYSGGGKTTVTKLLLRFMDVDSGSIKIDGQDVRDVKQSALRVRLLMCRKTRCCSTGPSKKI